MNRREAITRAGSLALAAMAGCSGEDGQSGSPTGPGDEPVVDVGPDGRLVFAPGTADPLVVPAGTTVTWVWRSNVHNVTVRSQPDRANWTGHETVENAGFRYEHTFDVPGEYHYVCVPHESAGMVGDLVVERRR